MVEGLTSVHAFSLAWSFIGRLEAHGLHTVYRQSLGLCCACRHLNLGGLDSVKHAQKRLGSTSGGHGRPTTAHGRRTTMSANRTAWTFLWMLHAVQTTQKHAMRCTTETETEARIVGGKALRLPIYLSNVWYLWLILQ